MTRLIRILCALGIILAGTMVSSTMAGPARAAIVDALCPLGSDNVSFDPGIVLLEQRQTTVDANFRSGTCTTSVPGVTSASVSNTYSALRSCTDLLTGQSGSVVLHWNNMSGPPQTSTVTYSQTVSRGLVATVVTSTGTVTSGLFKGDTVVRVETIPNEQFLACTTPAGMTSTSGVTQLTITGQ